MKVSEETLKLLLSKISELEIRIKNLELQFGVYE
jgi:hypothetical protein